MERNSTALSMQTDKEFQQNEIRKWKKNKCDMFNTFRSIGKVYAAEQEIRAFKKLFLSYKKDAKALGWASSIKWYDKKNNK